MTALLALDLLPDADPVLAVNALRQTALAVTSVDAAVRDALVALVEAETPAVLAAAVALLSARPDVRGLGVEPAAPTA